MANALGRFVQRVNRYPDWLARRLISAAFNHKVKLAGTCGIQILKTDSHSALLRQPNIKKARNHIGGVHAAAMALLAESATGFVVGINLPDNKLPLMKQMDLRFVRRAKGALTAKAWLTAEQISLMEQQDKGEIMVDVEVNDEDNQQPVICQMCWAWVPKTRK